jgi:EAL domain-containing protein (putative c-di-GMP-specific phosphodiesterase class I)
VELVAELGCHEGQGYFFARPMNGESIRRHLYSHDPAAQRVA